MIVGIQYTEYTLSDIISLALDSNSFLRR